MGAVPKLCVGVVCVTFDCEVVAFLVLHVCVLLSFVQVGKFEKCKNRKWGNFENAVFEKRVCFSNCQKPIYIFVLSVCSMISIDDVFNCVNILIQFHVQTLMLIF